MVNDGMTIISNGMFVTGGMTVYGSAYFQTPGPITYSDRRLKTRIQQLDTPLHKVSKLRGVYFSWIPDEESGLALDDRRHVGLIAQDVQAVLPEVVQEMGALAQGQGQGQGSYLGVNYAEMVPLLLEAIRELDERTSSLSAPLSATMSPPSPLSSPLFLSTPQSKSQSTSLLHTLDSPVSDSALSEHRINTYEPVPLASTCDRDELLRSIQQLKDLLSRLEKENELLLMVTLPIMDDE